MNVRITQTVCNELDDKKGQVTVPTQVDKEDDKLSYLITYLLLSY